MDPGLDPLACVSPPGSDRRCRQVPGGRDDGKAFLADGLNPVRDGLEHTGELVAFGLHVLLSARSTA